MPGFDKLNFYKGRMKKNWGGGGGGEGGRNFFFICSK